MKPKNVLFLALTSALISIALCITFQQIYNKAFYVDYSAIVSIPGLAGACLIAAMLIAWGNFFFLRWFGNKGQLIFNLLAGVLSFASILGPLSITLPLDIDPLMFPGLVIPMHFFPIMAHLAVLPAFDKKSGTA